MSDDSGRVKPKFPWLAAYWRWATGGSRWRLAAAAVGPLLALLVVLSAVFGNTDQDESATAPSPTAASDVTVIASTLTPAATTLPPTPPPTPEPRTHTVQAGDSLSAICIEQVPELSVDDCVSQTVELNDLADAAQIGIDQELALPGGESAVPNAASGGTGAYEGLAASIASLTVAPEERTGYDRDLFGDYDRDALLASNFAGWPACDGYYSLADDQCYTEASDVDVDHIVALAEAWDSGASAWTAEQRDEFAGVVINLWLMTDNLNQSKSAQDAAEWVPPFQEAKCFYIQAYIEVKIEWNLSVDQAEKSALESLAGDCEGTESLTVSPTIVPASQTPAPTIVPAVEQPTQTPTPTIVPTVGQPTQTPTPTIAPTVVQPTPSEPEYLPGDAYNCGDFATYAEAKAYFDAVSGDPSQLDGDGDGIPCESLPGAP